MKHCPKCDTDKPESDFYRNRSNADGLNPYCKPCFKAVMEERKQSDPERVRALDRDSYYRRKDTLNPRRNARRRKSPVPVPPAS